MLLLQQVIKLIADMLLKQFKKQFIDDANVNPGYTKLETDAKFITKTAQASIDNAQNLKIQKNINDIKLKQNSNW